MHDIGFGHVEMTCQQQHVVVAPSMLRQHDISDNVEMTQHFRRHVADNIKITRHFRHVVDNAEMTRLVVDNAETTPRNVV